jgi:hypothetical protein
VAAGARATQQGTRRIVREQEVSARRIGHVGRTERAKQSLARMLCSTPPLLFLRFSPRCCPSFSSPCFFLSLFPFASAASSCRRSCRLSASSAAPAAPTSASLSCSRTAQWPFRPCPCSRLFVATLHSSTLKIEKILNRFDRGTFSANLRNEKKTARTQKRNQHSSTHRKGTTEKRKETQKTGKGARNATTT